MQNIVFSGIQPTGNLTLGNYLGAIKSWVSLGEQYKSYFCLVDLHAITLPIDPNNLRQALLDNFALYLSCGLDMENTVLFKQSDSPHHADLGWILSCHTRLGWLNRMTQFKDKAGKDKQEASLGLYAYPTLQAADILLYHANYVPVGEDQVQHIELVRDIAGAFNRHYGVEFFRLPEALLPKTSKRVMSLRDGRSKMSKSDPSDMARINLRDSADLIMQKFMKAKSDSITGVSYDVEKRPEISNLLEIYATITAQSIPQVVAELEGLATSDFKRRVAEAVIAELAPVQLRFNQYKKDPGQLLQNLKRGGEKASEVAAKTYLTVKEIVGIN